VAVRFKQYRLAKGLSQRELAERTGLSRTAITMIESGQRNPTLFVCHALAIALNVPLSEVIEDAERGNR
jgi:transcriptional regulator with XRE-family HTH domain